MKKIIIGIDFSKETFDATCRHASAPSRADVAAAVEAAWAEDEAFKEDMHVKGVETLDMHDPASTQNKIISLMVGRELSQRYPSRESHIGEEIFRAPQKGRRIPRARRWLLR